MNILDEWKWKQPKSKPEKVFWCIHCGNILKSEDWFLQHTAPWQCICIQCTAAIATMQNLKDDRVE